jgi:hypothetical protein
MGQKEDAIKERRMGEINGVHVEREEKESLGMDESQKRQMSKKANNGA